MTLIIGYCFSFLSFCFTRIDYLKQKFFNPLLIKCIILLTGSQKKRCVGKTKTSWSVFAYVFFSSCTRSTLNNYEMLICLLFKGIQLLTGEETIIFVPITSVLQQTKKGLSSASL